MSEEVQQESAPEQEEAQELPTPTLSEVSVDQPTSTVPDLDDVVARFEEKLENRLTSFERKMQSQKDRRWDALEKQYGDLGEIRKVLAEKDEGLTEDSIILNVLAERLASQTEPASGSPETGTPRQLDTTKAQDILREAGVDFNDPDVTALFAGSYQSQQDFDMAAYDLERAKRTQASRPASPGVAAPSGGGVSGGGTNQDQLRQSFNQEAAGVRRGSEEMRNLRKKYRDLGMSFHTVIRE